jgi:pyruvate kinase
MLSHRRKVKIVGTLGPASNTVEILSHLIRDGLDIARLNFSHGTHEGHAKVIANIREASKIVGKPVAIMQDLQGPKIRVGVIKNQGQPGPGIDLKAGDTVILYPEGSAPKISTHGKIAIPISAEIAMPVAKDTQKGARILFDDGKISTVVKEVSPPEIVVEVTVGGLLTSNKGMNLPGTPLSIPCVTEKDLEDLQFGIDQGVDAIALSFVRNSHDIETVRERIRKQSNHNPYIIAKIEREEAVDLQDSIIEVADGLLVARGDMAVELGAQRVPSIQKRLIHTCNELGVPIITATQMLESMIGSPTPTRAEASDVANAVFDGTDAVMLSAETASGKFPREAIQTMAAIIAESERSPEFYTKRDPILPLPGAVVDSIEFSASRIAHHVGAVCIAVLTHSGNAAKVLAKYRPDTPIAALTDDPSVLRRLAFHWGVHGLLIPEFSDSTDLFNTVETILTQSGWADPEDHLVITSGLPTPRRGTTNTVKVHKVGAYSERNRKR